jgi:hypothetical protein
MKCPECDGEMVPGELVDRNYAVSGAQEWAERAGSILGIGSTTPIKIISYRCIKCGFLKNYAPSTRIEKKEKITPTELRLRK